MTEPKITCDYCPKPFTDGDGDESVCKYKRCACCDDEVLIPDCKKVVVLCDNCPLR